MRRVKFVALATWMVEHLTFGMRNEALSGDLLEELQTGRSPGWYWRQVLQAVAIGFSGMARQAGLLVVFAAAWTMLYPAWRWAGQDILSHAVSGRLKTLGWPGSAVMDVGLGITPAIAFIWAGFLVYVLLRRELIAELHPIQLVHGMSTSLTVLLSITLGMLNHLRHPNVDLRGMARPDFYCSIHFLNVSIPIACSLMAALLFTVSSAPQMRRRRGRSRRLFPVSITRAMQALCLLVAVSQSCGGQTPASGTVQFVTVDKDVKLEVVDWGGTGRPLIFLAGLGNDAHVFDTFAPRFTDHNHVYGITRRGFGASSKPAPEDGNYSADRLGDDVLAVITALKLERPVLAGHSIAGEELSSIGSRFPEKVAGLIYLDAGYGYAYYDKAHGDTVFDFFQLKKRLDEFTSGEVRDPGRSVQEMAADVSVFDRDLQEAMKRDPSVPELHAPRSAIPPIPLAINLGGQKYSHIPVPILAIFACPHNFDFDRALGNNPTLKAEVVAEDAFTTSRQGDAFAAGVPSARIVRLENADHFVFRSNEADVAREMNAFLAGLH